MTALAATPPAEQLTRAEAAAFHERGFLGPFTLCSPEEMAECEPLLTRTIASPAPWPGGEGEFQRIHNRHLDTPELRELAMRAPIRERVAGLIGPDLLLWRLHFWDKPPGAAEIPWHQDWNYWPLEPAVIVSAWVAVDHVTLENACVQIIPGSHREMRKHVPSTPGMAFHEMADLTGVDLDKKVDMELEPGQFFLFNERTLHHSDINRSSRRRMGFALRIIPPLVRMMSYDSDHHGALLMRGSDTLGFNRPATLVR
jgi:hypothetical protein